MLNPTKENIYYILRDRIANVYYRPGDHLYEKILAEEFGVSRTPIRESIIRLKQDNLVIIVPHGGARVSDINLKDFQKLIEIRLILERGAAQLAVRNASQSHISRLRALSNKMKNVKEGDINGWVECDSEFHQIIAEASENPFLIEYLSAIRLQFTRIQRIVSTKTDNVPSEIQKAANILENRDADEMIKLVIGHVEHFVIKVRSCFRIEQ
jgi:GntR family transcriptional regulator, rspAB operon transcriptional repressor